MLVQCICTTTIHAFIHPTSFPSRLRTSQSIDSYSPTSIILSSHRRRSLTRQRQTPLIRVTKAYSRTSLSLSSSSSSSSSLQHARDIFTLVDVDNSNSLDEIELGQLLKSLDIEATTIEINALFKYLDIDEDGSVTFEEFLPWYESTLSTVISESDALRSTLLDFRTVQTFDKTPISDDVLHRAIECALAAPTIITTNQQESQLPSWRFIKIGYQTISKLTTFLNEKNANKGNNYPDVMSDISEWCVVTTKQIPNDDSKNSNDGLDINTVATTSCAMSNFMLSMWSEGVGCQWWGSDSIQSQEFASLCGNINMKEERVIGVILYGFAAGGLHSSTTDNNMEQSSNTRRRSVDDVLDSVP